MNKDYSKQPSRKILLGMSIPISLGMLSTILFQIFDTYFVGTLGPLPLTALGFASTVYFLMIGLFIGFSVGISIIIGKAFGGGELSLVKKVSGLSLIIGFLIAGLLSAVGMLYVDDIFGLMGARQVLLPMIADYMVPLFAGMPLLAVGITAGSILRSTGYVKLPEILFGVAGIINVILDYLFIYGKMGFPELGIRGVAYGTVISWAFIFVTVIFFLIRFKLVSIDFKSWVQNKNIVKSMFSMGAPAVATQIVAPFTLLFITYILGRLSQEAVAAYGVAGRIETLLMIGIMAVGTASTPFIAQNVGAKQVSRINDAIVFGGKAAFYLGGLLTVLLIIVIRPVAGLFSNEESIVDSTALYFYIVGLSYIFYGLYLITASIFNGLQMPGKSLKIMLVKTFLFTVPLVIAGSYYGVTGVFTGLAASNILGGLFARWEMKKELKRVNSSLVKRNMFKDMLEDFNRLFNWIKLIKAS